MRYSAFLWLQGVQNCQRSKFVVQKRIFAGHIQAPIFILITTQSIPILILLFSKDMWLTESNCMISYSNPFKIKHFNKKSQSNFFAPVSIVAYRYISLFKKGLYHYPSKVGSKSQFWTFLEIVNCFIYVCECTYICLIWLCGIKCWCL